MIPDKIKVDGLTFSVVAETDYEAGPPHKENDCYGVVSEWTRQDKKPGERILANDRASHLYYDVPASITKATADGWSPDAETRRAMVERLQREPTRKEVIAEAVERDYRRLRAWYRDEWAYVYIVVTLLDVQGKPTDEREACGGLESDDESGIEACANDLAAEIAARIGDAKTLTRITKIRE
jgi:hypothetical protein